RVFRITDIDLEEGERAAAAKETRLGGEVGHRSVEVADVEVGGGGAAPRRLIRLLEGAQRHTGRGVDQRSDGAAMNDAVHAEGLEVRGHREGEDGAADL